MNTHKHRQTALLALAALLTLPAGLHAGVTDPATQSTSAHEAARATTVDLNREGAVNLSLETDSTTAAIGATAFAVRDHAIAIAERGSAEGRTIAGAIENGSARLQAEARADVDKAMRKAQQARERLDQAIERGRNATENRWDDARDEIASRYEKFSKALEKARETAIESGARLDLRVTDAADHAADSRS